MEVKQKEVEEERCYYPYIDDEVFLQKIKKRLQHPCKKDRCKKLRSEEKVGNNLA